MWGELAGRLGATDINATLEKIGNAVAPRDDDEDYCDDDDGSEESYDDIGYEEAEDDDNIHGDGVGIINKVAGASPFRLAGMLTRALDDRHSTKGILEETEINHDTNEKAISSIDLFSTASVGEKNSRGNNFHGETADQTVDTLQRTKNKSLPDRTRHPNTYIRQNHEKNEETLSETGEFSKQQTNQALPNCGGKPEEVATEHTSLKTTTEVESAVSTTTNNVVQVSHVKTNEVSKSINSMKGNNITEMEKNESISQNPRDLEEECHQITPVNFREVDVPTITTKVQNGDDHYEEKDILHSNDDKVATDLPSTRQTNVKRVVAVNDKFQQGNMENDDGFKYNLDDTSKGSKLNFTLRTENQLVPTMLDAKPEEASNVSVSNSPENTVQSDDDNGNLDVPTKPPSRKSKVSMEVSSHAIALSANEFPRKNAHNETDSNQSITTEDLKQKLLDADFKVGKLQNELESAKEEIKAIQSQALLDEEKAKLEKEELITQFHSKEARLLQATSEENQNQTELLQQEYSTKIQSLDKILVQERKQSKEEQAEYKRLLRESYSNVDQMENKLRTLVKKHENQIEQLQQREERALRKVDDRMAQTMAILDERDEEIKLLKKSIAEMESKVNEHQEGEEEAEEELEEVHEENVSLRQTIEKLEIEKKNLKGQVSKLKSGSEELSALQMELTMLKEERNRESLKNQAVMDSAMTSHTQLEMERDNALSELKDSKQQLGATIGDLEIARADYSRIIVANENLQSALEAFQDERAAEMEMIEEQRHESEEALKTAHATATSALKQIHENEMYEIQKASDNAVKNVMHEMELVETNLKKLKSDNNQMRRSLDEAIHRLQASQEDVIDRNVMKNILLDWCILNDKSKRHQVLQVMANLLHFSEEEKEKVHLTSKSLDSVRAKVVGALAAPLPPSKADVEHLEGSNVHEKWVNFLMAETDDA